MVSSTIRPTDNGYRYDTFATGDQSSHGESPSPAPAAAIAAKPTNRLLAPDLQRGLLMALMAMDHLSLGLHSWDHGTNRDGESAGLIVTKWNHATAYTVRTLTHLCAPGFMFLLGMGVVMLSRSRTKMGWSPVRLLRYYTIRMLVLTAVSAVMGFIMTFGQMWFMNAVLFALAVHYLLAGCLWLTMNTTEEWMAHGLEKVILSIDRRGKVARDDEDEEDGIHRSLLRGSEHLARSRSDSAALASSLSWHIHNTLLLILSIITICWNIWMAPNYGRCKLETSSSHISATDAATLTSTIPTNPLLRIWFWSVESDHIMSNFPPLAWISFAILGLVYGRILTARKWNSSTLTVGHLSASLLFALIFILTRVLQIGNLSEGCLRTPEQVAHPSTNPYLASLASFFYITKYPPDVGFFGFALAGNLLLLGVFGAIPTSIATRFAIILDFGTSALFFYVVHILVILSPLFNAIKNTFGHDTGIPDMMNPGSTKGVTNVFAYFSTWFILMLILWPLCRYWSRFKSTRHADSLWRLF